MGGPQNGRQVELTEGKQVLIGRGANCDIVIDHASISRKHAEVTFSWSGAFIRDLDSANGVYCNEVHATLQLDHIVARANGGTNALDNLVSACPRCNRRKSALTIEAFVDVAFAEFGFTFDPAAIRAHAAALPLAA